MCRLKRCIFSAGRRPVCRTAFSGTALISSGQRISVSGAAAGDYFAATPARPMPAAGRTVWVEARDLSFSGSGTESGVYVSIIGLDAIGNPAGQVYFGTDGTDQAGGVAGSAIIGPVSGLAGMGLGVDSDGEVWLHNIAAGEIIKASDVEPLAAGAFASAIELMIYVQIKSSTEVSGAASVVTAQSLMKRRSALVGGEDWCRNPIIK